MDIDWHDRCAVCGTVIDTSGMAWAKVYCGRECHAKAVSARKREQRAAARAGMKCVWCGQPMEAKRADRKYCSRGCTHAAWRDFHRDRLRVYMREYQRRLRAGRRAETVEKM